MKSLSKTTRNASLIPFALMVLAFSQSGHAQAADSTLTFSGNVTNLSCYARIAAGSGASGSGVGASSATLTLPNINITENTKALVIGAEIPGATVKFTVGLAATLGGSAGCGSGATFNTVFTSPATGITTVVGLTGRTFLVNSGGAQGVAVELFSFDSTGASQKQRISNFPTAINTVNFSPAPAYTNPQTGLDAVSTNASQSFEARLIKTAATGTQLGAGSLTAAVTVSHQVF